MFGLRKFCDGHRLVKNLTTILLSGISCSLIVYSLIVQAGDIITSGCKKIGFYNYCFNNETSAGCYCITQLKDLHAVGFPASEGLLVALVLTYSSLVTSFAGFLVLGLAQYFHDCTLWMFALVCHALGLTSLFLGLIMKLIMMGRFLELSQLSQGFLALLLAIAGLCVLCLIMRHYASLKMKNLEI
ncbi:transmembrane protein 140 [Spea bombifrons]|uniref:transmembrane protein 140 n=1 Tax=Spea bombifrons TaxID=233779 RepID=UPI002348F394|nr:transmembrane protein 140 [Spea bombifrons]